MPEALERMVSALIAQGKSKDSAYAIATSVFQKRKNRAKKHRRDMK